MVRACFRACVAQLEMEMTIRELKKDETFSTTLTINGKIVNATWSVRKNEDGPRYAVTSKFDFGAVSTTELYELAMRSVIIDVQRQWRILANAKGSTATRVNPFATVNVKTAVIDAGRKTADPKTRASNLLAKLSEAERKAVLAMFAEKKAS